MKFGKISYLNLLPFDIFIKKYPIQSSFKMFINHHTNYPAKLNKDFLHKRIDAGFISSIAGVKANKTKSGIIAYGAVWSVIAINRDNKLDYQSASSNILSQILNVKGEILIGDRALRYIIEHNDYIDLGERWHQKHSLPFVFGLLCCNKNTAFYNKLSNTFNKSKPKIPHYILQIRAVEAKLPKQFIKEYLNHIHYKVTAKAQKSLNIFYRQVRLKQLKAPARF